jgi:DNA-binding transcriptional regulator GbsR (MarR family)
LNGTVAQIHALLYLAPKPLAAEEIASLLPVARSSVTRVCAHCKGWGVVRVVHVLGERRDHFETIKDVWELFYIILEERNWREIDPTLAVLRECAMESPENTPEGKEAHKRIREMLAFFEQTSGLYDEFGRIRGGALKHLLKCKGQLKRLFVGAAS